MKRFTKAGIKLTSYSLILIILLGTFFPIFWMVSTSVKQQGDIIKMPPVWIPSTLNLDHYKAIIEDLAFWRYFANSLIVSIAVAIINVILASLSGYAFSRFRFKGRKSLLLVILATQMFPLVLLLISLYTFFSELHLLDTYAALIVSFLTFSLPFSIWMMKNFFDTIPKELEEAAMIDGCSRLRSLFKVILPLSLPGVVATATFCFLNAYNNLLYSLTLTSSDEMRTIPPGMIMRFITEFSYRWGEMMAASLMITIPLVMIFTIFQKYMVKGLTAGAVKG